MRRFLLPAVMVAFLAGCGSERGRDVKLISVQAVPGNQPSLSSKRENTVVVSSRDFGFRVTVANAGDHRAENVKVCLAIFQTPGPILRIMAVGAIDPGQQKSSIVRVGAPVEFAAPWTLTVNIEHVLGDKNFANDSASYLVIFALG